MIAGHKYYAIKRRETYLGDYLGTEYWEEDPFLSSVRKFLFLKNAKKVYENVKLTYTSARIVEIELLEREVEL